MSDPNTDYLITRFNFGHPVYADNSHVIYFTVTVQTSSRIDQCWNFCFKGVRQSVIIHNE